MVISNDLLAILLSGFFAVLLVYNDKGRLFFHFTNIVNYSHCIIQVLEVFPDSPDVGSLYSTLIAGLACLGYNVSCSTS